jgi:hypothetical protein
MKQVACSGVRVMSLIGIRLPAIQAHAVFEIFRHILFTKLEIAVKSRSVGMENKQRPPLREAQTAPTALFSSESAES